MRGIKRWQKREFSRVFANQFSRISFFTNLLEFFKVFGYLKKKWTWLVPIFKKVIQLWRVWRRLLNKHEINTFYFILCRSRKSFCLWLETQGGPTVSSLHSRWCHFAVMSFRLVRGNNSTRGPTVSSLHRRWCHFAVMSFRFGAMIRLVDLRFQASFVDGASEPRIDLKPKKQSNLIHQLTP